MKFNNFQEFIKGPYYICELIDETIMGSPC